jgi:hypothetical protein
MKTLKITKDDKPKLVGYLVDSHFGEGFLIEDEYTELSEFEKESSTPLYAIPEGYSLVPDDQLKDGGVAQKAFWHALEFCTTGRNIRAHWEDYKEMLKAAKEDV